MTMSMLVNEIVRLVADQNAEILDQEAGIANESLKNTALDRKIIRVGPKSQANVDNAWEMECKIGGGEKGSISGKRVILKDNIQLRGAPFSLGRPEFDDVVATEDAAVVEKIEAAGGCITGIANTEAFCLSGTGGTARNGFVRNPVNRDRVTGGSSSGCAAAVGNGSADLAVGSDQGGSIRGPSAWCGIYGLKPSHGSVPYEGAFSLEPTLDHLGPMAKSLEELALFADVLMDPVGIRSKKCESAFKEDLRVPSVSLVKEGFDWSKISDERVEKVVKDAAKKFKNGSSVNWISVPTHRIAYCLWQVILSTGLVSSINGGLSLAGVRDTLSPVVKGETMRYLVELLKGNAPVTLTNMLEMGSILKNYTEQSRSCGAKDILLETRLRIWQLRKEYDRALSISDVLAMPTRVFLPPKIADIEEGNNAYPNYATALNTCGCNLTGHPSLSVPCGEVDGLPVGMMFIAKHGREDLLIGSARALDVVY